jgi:hypothetical protein
MRKILNYFVSMSFACLFRRLNVFAMRRFPVQSQCVLHASNKNPNTLETATLPLTYLLQLSHRPPFISHSPHVTHNIHPPTQSCAGLQGTQEVPSSLYLRLSALLYRLSSLTLEAWWGACSGSGLGVWREMGEVDGSLTVSLTHSLACFNRRRRRRRRLGERIWGAVRVLGTGHGVYIALFGVLLFTLSSRCMH